MQIKLLFVFNRLAASTLIQDLPKSPKSSNVSNKKWLTYCREMLLYKWGPGSWNGRARSSDLFT